MIVSANGSFSFFCEQCPEFETVDAYGGQLDWHRCRSRGFSRQTSHIIGNRPTRTINAVAGV